MPSLEILDVSRNRITVIPPKIANLTSLKVLAIAKNRIEELPVCLGDINSLQVLKLDGNPLKFPPPEVCRIQENVPSPANENVRDAAIATQVKKFMRQASQEKRVETERLRVESSGDESWTESNPETPRPSRRVNGGRFPVRPSIGSVDGFNESRPGSPGIAPPIPSRSHYRNQSSQNGFIRRPNISPLILSNGSNERNRSQSEGATSASHRQKRMGIYTNKTSELGAVDELKRNNHFRNFSQGYVQPGNASNGMSGPATAIGYGDSTTVRSLANRPLSDVREHRRDSRAPDVVVEAAKNFLYAMSQIHDSISGILQTIRRADRSEEGIRRVKDFKRRYELTYKHISELDERLRAFDTLSEEAEDDANKLSQDIYSCTLKSIEHFMSLNLSIAENRVIIVKKVDPRQLRTYLFLHQGSLVEMRNACAILGADFSDSAPASRGPSRTDLMSTVRARPKARRYQASPPQRNGHYPGPPAVVLHSNDNSRTNTLTSITSISAATPRSGESFSTLATTMSRANTLTSTFDEHDEDVHFERIYAKLRNACDSCSAHIPEISQILRLKFETLRRELDSDDPKLKVLMGLIDKCALVMESIHALGQRLSQVQLKDSHSRCQPGFWQQCMSFIKVRFLLAAVLIPC